jgi:hypothetical protein
MNKNKTPQEILDKCSMHGKSVDVNYTSAIDAMHEYADQEWKAGFIEGRDKALEWAAQECDNNMVEQYIQEQILTGKTAKELQP